MRMYVFDMYGSISVVSVALSRAMNSVIKQTKSGRKSRRSTRVREAELEAAQAALDLTLSSSELAPTAATAAASSSISSTSTSTSSASSASSASSSMLSSAELQFDWTQMFSEELWSLRGNCYPSSVKSSRKEEDVHVRCTLGGYLHRTASKFGFMFPGRNYLVDKCSWFSFIVNDDLKENGCSKLFENVFNGNAYPLFRKKWLQPGVPIASPSQVTHQTQVLIGRGKSELNKFNAN
jgi:hypothetical protein